MRTTPSVYWITGLPAAGKTSLAHALSQALRLSGFAGLSPYFLDGDDLRRGLCSDLGLSPADRGEDIRRAGEVARLMADAGITVICAFVSPFAADRQRVRALFAPAQFIEIFLSTSVDECARRDTKGLYAKAKAGQITGLTGWDAPYERPGHPEFAFDTETLSIEAMVQTILDQRFLPPPALPV